MIKTDSIKSSDSISLKSGDISEPGVDVIDYKKEKHNMTDDQKGADDFSAYQYDPEEGEKQPKNISKQFNLRLKSPKKSYLHKNEKC